ncbi:MAG: OmpH family outer membrane protein [Planctomycetes bacterium]|nr:OmpH family outer membrane protein [Planctomycetota bacterium]
MRVIMKTLLGASVLAFLLISTGCQKPAASSGGVAVIDLDKVATAMGWLDEISKSIQAADVELRAHLSEVLRNSLRSVEGAKAQIAAEAKLTPEQTKILTSAKDDRELAALPLTKEQRTRLVETVNKANTEWRTALNNYQQTLQGRRANLILNYREKIRPTARRVAASKGMNVVVTTSDNLLYYDPQSSEITDQVIEELQKIFPEKKQVSAPAQPAPPARTNPPPAK